MTGGGGFLGRYIVEKLLARGDEVTAASRRIYPELQALGASSIALDLTDGPGVLAACSGKDVVFHVAARVGLEGSYQDFWDANVMGTDHVLAGCRAGGVAKLVFTSSPSVVFDGKDQCGVDESHPYPDSYLTHYPATKAESERRILAAHGEGGLFTTVLRPHIIFGPRDNSLLPRLAERARQGVLTQVGGGKNRVDVVYVENAADAHLLAADSDNAGGKAYFISQGKPVLLWEFIADLLQALDLPPVTRQIPYPVAYGLGALAESVHGLLRLSGEPRISRFLAAELAHSHHYDISRARRDLGYTPQVSTDEGIARLAEWWRRREAGKADA